MILAAGYGTRMRPLTAHTPKPLLVAGGKPLIVHTIERLVAAGISNIVVNHSWLGSQIEAELGSGSRFGVSIVYSPEDSPLETAGGIRAALPLLGTGADFEFIVTNGDVYCEYDYGELLKRKLAADELAHLLLTDNPSHHPDGDFLLQPDGRVRSKPLLSGTWKQAAPAERSTFAGIGRYRSSLFSALPSGPYPLAPVLRKAMDSGQVSGSKLAGRWFDIGTEARLNELNVMLQA